MSSFADINKRNSSIYFDAIEHENDQMLELTSLKSEEPPRSQEEDCDDSSPSKKKDNDLAYCCAMLGCVTVREGNRRDYKFAVIVAFMFILGMVIWFIYTHPRDRGEWKFTGNDDPTKPKPWVRGAQQWWNMHRTLVKEVKVCDANKLQGNVLVFLGDSITESWRGTQFGSVPGPSRKWKPGEDAEIRASFQAHFAKFCSSGLSPLALGIAGDQTQHLLWRIQHGGLPSSSKHVHTFVVLIGTNNIGGGTLPLETVLGIQAVVRHLLKNSKNAKILLCELLPRYDSQRVARLCPPRCKKDGTTPFDSFLPAIDKVNEALPEMVQHLRDEFGQERIVVSSCNSIFENSSFIISQVMPDHLHPNARGHELWASCLEGHLSELLDAGVGKNETLPLVLTHKSEPTA